MISLRVSVCVSVGTGTVNSNTQPFFKKRGTRAFRLPKGKETLNGLGPESENIFLHFYPQKPFSSGG